MCAPGPKGQNRAVSERVRDPYKTLSGEERMHFAMSLPSVSGNISKGNPGFVDNGLCFKEKEESKNVAHHTVSKG